MNIQERKRYNLVIYIIFGIFFLIYGSLGAWVHLEGIEPFSDWLPNANVVLSFLFLGFLGGWVWAGLVGGVWLGIRFVKKQNKLIRVLACVFALSFWFVGIVIAVPFAIYNLIKAPSC